MTGPNVLDELVASLRSEGLDASVAAEKDTVLVGTRHRGELASPATVRIRAGDAAEYLSDIAAGWDGDDPAEHAFGILIMLLVEALSSVHDGENNMVTEVELRRGLNGRLSLHETSIESGAPLPPPGDRYGWTSEP